MIGMISERRGDLDAALNQFQNAIRINPSYVEALLALAKASSASTYEGLSLIHI